jgi:hypothetical protein
MKIKKIAGKIVNEDDAIMYIFNGCNGEVLSKLIPAEYEVLLNKYTKIMMERNKPKDLPGQLTFFDDVKA